MEMLNIETFLLLGVASFSAGFLNALAGGGTFFTLPTLLYVGLPPVTANATNASILLPGYLGAVMGLRKSLIKIDKYRLLLLLLFVITGALGGAFLLIQTTDIFFRDLVPWLILVATVLFLIGPIIAKYTKDLLENTLIERLGILLVSSYGGYFNGGLGIALLAVFSVSGNKNIEEMLALKALFSFVLTLVSVIVFSMAGLVFWPLALGMMILAALGGYIGGFTALRLPSKVINTFIIFVGLTMSTILFIY